MKIEFFLAIKRATKHVNFVVHLHNSLPQRSADSSTRSALPKPCATPKWEP